MSAMARSSPSLFAPLFVTCCSLVFAVGAGYAWWTDRHAPAPLPAKQAPAIAVVRPAPAAMAAAGPVLRKCLGRDGVPVFTTAACPAGSVLEREIAVEVSAQAPTRLGSPPAVAPALAVANANATVVLPASGYDMADRGYRRELERERAWDRCDRGKVRARSELAALRNRRTMSQIRQWEAYVLRECAPYQVMTR
jgi:hypothetical protein